MRRLLIGVLLALSLSLSLAPTASADDEMGIERGETLTDEARTEIEGLLEDSPSLRRKADSLIKKQIGAAAKLAADDLRHRLRDV